MGDNAKSHSAAPGRPCSGCLFDVAAGQGGYFTASQAHACGYSRALLSHHARSGRFVRVRRGLYRLHEYPSSSREDVLAAWLALGKDAAAVSHESALDLLGLSDVIPNSVHLTVPRSRRHHPALEGVTVHTTSRPLLATDRTLRDGVILTSATRTLLDAAEAGTDPDQIEIAVKQAVERGLATPQQLEGEAGSRNQRVQGLIERALSSIEQ